MCEGGYRMKGMIFSRGRATGIVVILSIVFLFGMSWAAEEFSADFISKSSDPRDMPGQGKIYMKGNRLRIESSGSATISDPDRGVLLIIMEQQRMYMEQPLQNAGGRMQEWNSSMENAAKKVGTETVSGLKCTKYELESGGHKVTYWISEKISFPVKMEDRNGSMLLKNIEFGNVPGSLFELPPGYQKFSMPSIGGGMPGMPGGMGMPSK
jgi:hypothetical protein